MTIKIPHYLSLVTPPAELKGMTKRRRFRCWEKGHDMCVFFRDTTLMCFYCKTLNNKIHYLKLITCSRRH